MALVVPGTPGCHITIGNNKDASAEDVADMRKHFATYIEPCFPFEVQVCNFRLRGNKNEFPTYDCRATSPGVQHLLETFYRTHYNGKEGKYLYPLLEMHVTIDTEERRDAIEKILRRNANGSFMVEEAIFETRNDAADASAVFDAHTWTCLRCQHVNLIGSKTCSGTLGGTLVCTQWRPKAAMVPPVPRDGDWECCGELQFKTRLACRKCGTRKNQQKQHRVSTVADEYDPRTVVCPAARTEYVYREGTGAMCPVVIGGMETTWTCPFCKQTQPLVHVTCKKCPNVVRMKRQN